MHTSLRIVQARVLFDSEVTSDITCLLDRTSSNLAVTGAGGYVIPFFVWLISIEATAIKRDEWGGGVVNVYV